MAMNQLYGRDRSLHEGFVTDLHHGLLGGPHWRATSSASVSAPDMASLPGSCACPVASSISASASLAAQFGRRLIHRVSDALRVVIGKRPHASARLVHEPAPRRIEWI